MGELVVTTLGRVASPVIRYRTGDIVTPLREPCACGRTLARIVGGVLARTDDMVNVRGVNVYPAAIESVVRQFHEIGEFRSTVSSTGTMRALAIEIELNGDGTGVSAPTSQDASSQRLREALGLTVAVARRRPRRPPALRHEGAPLRHRGIEKGDGSLFSQL